MPTLEQDRLANEIFYEAITNDDMQKVAEAEVNDYIRLKLRERGFTRQILPSQTITNSELDRQHDTPLPAKVVDMEIDSPAAIAAPFLKTPDQCYIHGQRFRCTFNRILSPWFTADVDELRTHVMDIRQVMSDNSLKDMLATEDAGFVSAYNTFMGGSQGATGVFSGIVQWQRMVSGISRVGYASSLQIMPTMDGHLTVEKVLVNNVTIYELYKWGRDEMGGDMSQDIVKDGFTLKNFMGTNTELIVTIKRNLVPDMTLMQFGNPQFMGKFFELSETTMYIKREYFILSWFAYNCISLTLANPYSLTRTDFTG